MRRLLVLLTFALILLAPPSALACKCAPPPPELSLSERAERRASGADVVFEGKLESLRLRWGLVNAAVGEWIAADESDVPTIVASFSVSRTYRGAHESRFHVVTGLGGGDCGFDFEVEQQYLVYADEDLNGDLSTSICSGTALLEESAANLAYLRGEAVVQELSTAQEPAPVGKVCGRIGVPKGTDATDGEVAFLRVRNKALMPYDGVAPSEDGTYCAELPAGTYQVLFASGSEESPASITYFPGVTDLKEARRTEVQGGQVSTVEFEVPHLPVFDVQGRVANFRSLRLEKEVQILLVSTDQPMFMWRYVGDVTRNGTFHFRGVLPGKYWAAVIIDSDDDGKVATWLTRKIEVNVDSDIADLALELIRN